MVGGLGKSVGSSLGSVGVLPAALTAGGLTLLARNAIQTADDLGDLGARLGLTADQLLAMQIATERAGASTETLTQKLPILSKTIADIAGAAKPTGDAADALNLLGLSARDLVNLPVAEQVNRIADAFAGLENQSQKNQVAMVLFGKGASELVPLLSQGSRGIAKAADDMKRLGAVVGEDTVQELGNLNDEIQLMNHVMDVASIKLTSAVAPMLVFVVQQVSALAGWISSLSSGTKTMIGLITGLVGVMGVLVLGVKVAIATWTAYAAVKTFILGLTGAGLLVIAAATVATALAMSTLSGVIKSASADAAKSVSGFGAGASGMKGMAKAAIDLTDALNGLLKKQGQMITDLKKEVDQLGMSREEKERHNLLLEREAAARDLVKKLANASAAEVQALTADFYTATDVLQKHLAELQRLRTQYEAFNKQTEEIADIFKDIREEILTTGKSAQDIGLERLLELGASTKQIQDYMAMMGELEAVQKRMADAENMKKFAAGVQESLKTPADKFKEFRSQIDAAVKAGLLTADQASRALEMKMGELMQLKSETTRPSTAAIEAGTVAAYSVAARSFVVDDQWQKKTAMSTAESNRILREIATELKNQADDDPEVATL